MTQKLLSGLTGFVFIFIQFGGIAIILLTGPLLASGFILQFIEALGFLLGIWAILSMKPDNVRVLPDIKTNARFVETGPYRLIRHPMYTAIILSLTPLVINKYSLLRLAVLILIFVDLIFKSIYEEYLLKRHFDNYGEYIKRTYRYIPFIF